MPSFSDGQAVSEDTLVGSDLPVPPRGGLFLRVSIFVVPSLTRGEGSECAPVLASIDESDLSELFILMKG